MMLQHNEREMQQQGIDLRSHDCSVSLSIGLVYSYMLDSSLITGKHSIHCHQRMASGIAAYLTFY